MYHELSNKKIVQFIQRPIFYKRRKRRHFSLRGMSFESFVNGKIVPLVDGAIVPLMYALAFLFFLFGVARYFFADGEENREKGKKFAFWGIIAFVVLFSVWGIVKLLLSVIQ